MNKPLIEILLASITLSQRLFPEYRWRVLDKGDGFLIQLVFVSPCSHTGELEPQHCRKWYISSHSTRNEVIRSAHKACHAAMAHEIDEAFLYENRRVCNPHRDITIDLPDPIDQRIDKR